MTDFSENYGPNDSRNFHSVYGLKQLTFPFNKFHFME
jgi:hypothetical protein